MKSKWLTVRESGRENTSKSNRSLQKCGGTLRKKVDGIKEEKFRGSGNAAVKSSCFLPVFLLTKGCAIKGRLLLLLGVGMKCAALDGFQCHVMMTILDG